MEEENKPTEEAEIKEGTEGSEAEADSVNVEEVQPIAVEPKGKSSKKNLIYALAVLLVVAVGVIVYLVMNKDDSSADATEITSYAECVAAGYPVMESYPEQCAVPGGETFTRVLSDDETADMEGAAYCGEGLSEYTNEEIGFHFCYPSDWGTVMFADETEALASGVGHSLSFSDNDMVGATVRTTDWQTDLGRGGGYFDSPTTFSTDFTPEPLSTDIVYASDLIATDDNYLVTAYCSDFLGAVAVDALVEIGGDDYDAMKFYYLFRAADETGIDFSGCEDVKTLVSPVSPEMVELAQSFETI